MIRPLFLAPWVIPRVVDGQLHLLGPSLRLLRLGGWPDPIGSRSDRARLRREGFLRPKCNAIDRRSREVATVAAGRRNDTAYIVASGEGHAGERLLDALKRLDSERDWRLTSALPRPSQGMRPLTLVLRPIERRGRRDLTRLLDTHRVIWLADCIEGAHVGPVLEDAAVVDSYLRGSSALSPYRRLDELGFRSRPASFMWEVLRRPELAARAVIECLAAGIGSCAIVGGSVRELPPWRPGHGTSLKAQCWSKGAIGMLNVRKPFPGVGVYFGDALASTTGERYYEHVAGRGRTREAATQSTLGEAIERHCAWRANASTAGSARRRLDDAVEILGVTVDPRTVQQQHRMVTMRSLVNCRDLAIPIDIVAFPSPGPFGNKTLGLAAHTSESSAIAHALTELLEFADWSQFVRGQSPQRVAHTVRRVESFAATRALRQLVAVLARRGTHFAAWSRTLGEFLVVAHVVAHSNSAVRPIHGAGCCPSLSEAGEKALLEVLHHPLVEGPDLAAHSSGVRGSTLVLGNGRAVCCERGAVPSPAVGREAVRIPDAVSGLLKLGWEPFFVPIQCAIEGWHVVRVVAVRSRTAAGMVPSP